MLRCCLAVFIRIEARFDEGSNIPDILHKEGLSEKVKISPECPIRFLNSYQSYMWNTDHSDPNLTSSYEWTQTIFVRF